jgi:hypothetical protein
MTIMNDVYMWRITVIKQCIALHLIIFFTSGEHYGLHWLSAINLLSSAFCVKIDDNDFVCRSKLQSEFVLLNMC